MAITWQNINTPNFGGSNNLAVAGGNSIVQGIRSLQEAARGEGQRRIDEFNTGTSRNTADILNQISTTDATGLDRYNADTLKGIYGNQIDINQVTDATSARRDMFKQEARLATQDARMATKDEQEAEAHNMDLKVKDNTLKLSAAQLAAVNADTAKKNASIANATEFMSNLDKYSSLEDLAQDATRFAAKNKMGFDEASSFINNASNLWNINIGPEFAKEYLTNIATQGTQYNTEVTSQALRKLDTVAMTHGFNPAILKFSTDPNTDVGEVFEEFIAAGGDNAGILSTGNIDTFKSLFSNIMNTNPTASEARYLLSTAVNDGWWSKGEIDEDTLKESLEKYKKILGGEGIVNWYKDSQATINSYSNEYSKNVNSMVKNLQKEAISQRQRSFRGDTGFTPVTQQDVSVRSLAPSKLTDVSWIAPPKKEDGGDKTSEFWKSTFSFPN